MRAFASIAKRQFRVKNYFFKHTVELTEGLHFRQCESAKAEHNGREKEEVTTMPNRANAYRGEMVIKCSAIQCTGVAKLKKNPPSNDRFGTRGQVVFYKAGRGSYSRVSWYVGSVTVYVICAGWLTASLLDAIFFKVPTQFFGDVNLCISTNIGLDLSVPLTGFLFPDVPLPFGSFLFCSHPCCLLPNSLIH